MKYFIPLSMLVIAACNNTEENKPESQQSKKDSTVPLPVVDSMVISERIDGPANIRDTVNGSILFTLNDNIKVTSTDPVNGWCQIGLVVDLPASEKLKKGTVLKANGVEVGNALSDIELQSSFRRDDGMKGEIIGYTSLTNLKPYSIPEKVLTDLINKDSAVPTFEKMDAFLKNFAFQKYNGLVKKFSAYEVDENWVDDPSPLLRLWLFFENKELFGVIHSRKLDLRNSKTHELKRGFYLSVIGSQDEQLVKELIEKFNAFIVQVD